MAIRVMLFLKRRSDMTHEEFSKYWTENHADIFMAVPGVKQNFVKYNLFHVIEPASDVLRSVGVKVIDFDGVAEFTLNKLEDLLAVVQTEEYQKTVVPDESKFFDREATQFMVGHDDVKLQN